MESIISKIKKKVKESFIWKNKKIKSILIKIEDKRKHLILKKEFKKYGASTLFDIYDLLINEGFTVFPAFGTLLGLIRDRQLIRDDLDLDFALIDSENCLENLTECLLNNGYKIDHWYEHDGNKHEITFKSKKSKYITIDFFLFEKKENCFYKYGYRYFEGENSENNNGKFSVWREELPLFSNFKELYVYGRIIKVPENSNELLFSSYGKKWKIKDKNWSSNKKTNTILMNDTFGCMRIE